MIASNVTRSFYPIRPRNGILEKIARRFEDHAEPA
jgi:hypothetical protein